MRRSDREISIAKRRWREHRRIVEFNNEMSLLVVTLLPTSDLQIGHFRKRDAYDCGNSRCCTCHRDKYPKRMLTSQERIARLKLREGLAELEI